MQEKKATADVILKSICDYFGLTIKSLSEELGHTSPSSLYAVMKRKPQRLSERIIKQLVEKFPELDIQSLRTSEYPIYVGKQVNRFNLKKIDFSDLAKVIVSSRVDLKNEISFNHSERKKVEADRLRDISEKLMEIILEYATNGEITTPSSVQYINDIKSYIKLYYPNNT